MGRVVVLRMPPAIRRVNRYSDIETAAVARSLLNNELRVLVQSGQLPVAPLHPTGIGAPAAPVPDDTLK